jgi:hydrogenase/urease accessory protein HupE
MRLGSLGAAVLLVATATQAAAHQVPFSYLDVRTSPTGLDLSLVAHIIDVAHEIGVDPPDRLLDPATLAANAAAIDGLFRDRLRLTADGLPRAPATWSVGEPLPERQSVQFRTSLAFSRPFGALNVQAALFPYDPAHRTFVNIYDAGELATQEVLEVGRAGLDYYSGTRQGTLAVVRRFVPSGVEHILIGPDHLLFLIGLLLMGGTLRQLLLVVTAFTVAHSVTLSLAALNIFTPPARVIEPAIALSIVYVGADNLLVRQGRDVRAWIALAFGFIHGFGFANVLREMGLPRRALGWSLFSFNVGVEIGQLLVVIAVAGLLAALRARSEVAGRRLAFVGSVVVIAAGVFWFVQRVFFQEVV